MFKDNGLITKRGEDASERMCIRIEAVVAGPSVSNLDYGAPIREAGTEVPIFVEPLAQAIQSLSVMLAWRARQ